MIAELVSTVVVVMQPIADLEELVDGKVWALAAELAGMTYCA